MGLIEIDKIPYHPQEVGKQVGTSIYDSGKEVDVAELFSVRIASRSDEQSVGK